LVDHVAQPLTLTIWFPFGRLSAVAVSPFASLSPGFLTSPLPEGSRVLHLSLCLLLVLETGMNARQIGSPQTPNATTTTTAKTSQPRPRRQAARPDSQRPKANTTKAKANTTKAYQQRQARAHAKAEEKRQAQCDKVQVLPVCNARAAGIDIGEKTHWVCVGFSTESNAELIREFATHSQGLRDLVAYLRAHQVDTVAMESTGVYWKPLFALLLKEGFRAILVPPQYTRQVQGRPKTDKRDCQWIYRLHSVGLLPAAFQPDEAIGVLRSYLRERANNIRDASRHIQRMQKALEQMNLKLTGSIADITGLTGQKIIRAILQGTRDPYKLAALRHPKCKADAEQIARALDGTYRDEHLFALRQAYEAWRFYQKQLDKVDEEIARQLERLKRGSPLPPLEPKRRTCGRKANDLRFEAREALYYVVGIDLTELEGLSALSALTLLSEIGTDLTKFATVKHFCSWLGLCPHFKKTGGKVKSSRTRAGQSRAAKVLRLSASSLHSSTGALGGFLRRMKGRLGAPAAVTATAHKLARLVYYALTRGMTYVRQTQEEYEKQYREKQIQQLKKKARRLGFELQAKPAAEQVEGKTTSG
jgi:transposase